jgi:radical SAM protein with 4Fe4S-binding SPASM domain
MINLSRLLFDYETEGDRLRYRSDLKQARPIVVWNITRRCNLKCRHCYADSKNRFYPGEVKKEEAFRILEDLAGAKIPVVLFSGGEPLLRTGIFELVAKARDLGLRPVLSTNGTMITSSTARALKKAGLAYAGVSLDGVGERNDFFRGVSGAYSKTLKGIRNAQDAGIKTGLRFTITRLNMTEIPAIFDLIDKENIVRACFYHLVCTGRGTNLLEVSLTPWETRQAMDTIISLSGVLFSEGRKAEILTVDNHADGPYLYLQVKKRDPVRAKMIYSMLKMNAGNRSGIGIAGMDWNGQITPDQFWQSRILGNIHRNKFTEIWDNPKNPTLKRLREYPRRIKGRCGECRFLGICNGNFRARAEVILRDPWASDPACYLSDEEIGIKGQRA